MALLLAAVVVGACADVLDIDGIEIGIGDGGATQVGSGGSTSEGGSATNSGGSTSQGGAGGMGGALAENCENGIDDNDDALIDCEDPLCVAFVCAEEPPEDWLGPYASHIDATAAAACPASAPNELVAGGAGTFSAPPASCDTCMCSAPTNVSCSIPMIDFYDSDTCLNNIVDLDPNSVGNCESVNTPSIADSLRGRSSQPSGGSCAPAGGAPTSPAAAFDESVRVCGPDTFGGGCGAGSVCMPAPESPFSDKPCITRSGDRACPAGPYSEKTLVYEDVTDTRDCTLCSCGNPVGVTCDAATTVYSDNTCQLDAIVVPHDNSCTPINIDVESWRFDFTADGGSCAASGGVPTGSASPTNPTTVCCVP